MTTPPNDRFSLLPIISDAVRETVVKEMDEFNRLTPEAREDRLDADLNILHQQNDEMAHAIEGLSEGPISQDYISDRLTHTEWLWLRSSVQFAFLMMARALNEARREEIGKG